MKLYGVALLPDAHTTRDMVRFQNRNIAAFGSLKLGTHTNIPHLSVLQCPFNASSLTHRSLEQLVRRWRPAPKRQTFAGVLEELYYQPRGWQFARVDLLGWGGTLQKIALQHLGSEIDFSELKKAPPSDEYSHAERANYLRYGYRYVGDEFRPHITLGRDLSGKKRIDGTVADEFDRLFRGHDFRFVEAVYYEAGVHGALKTIIAREAL
jgi:hypothetical protein